MRQLLLLLSRIAVAALLITMLCGWIGGRRALSVLGGTTTHHVLILDDSYSMGDLSLSSVPMAQRTDLPDDAYRRALRALHELIQRLSSDDGNHQLTVMRASRAALAVRGGVDSGDVAADISAQTITGDGRLASRVMATQVSPIRCELTEALDLSAELIRSTPADATYLYIASDFRRQDWGSPDRFAQTLKKLPAGTSVRMIDCAVNAGVNLAVTDLTPVQDVWVSGVPVVVHVTVKNYSQRTVASVPLQTRVIQYGDSVSSIDPTSRYSGSVDSLPTMVIESLPPGASVTKTFQVYVAQKGTHAIEASLPDDVLMIDNSRACTLPLSDVEKVLIIDGDDEEKGAYHLSTVLDPGSQVRIGAVPDVKPPSFLRSATLETLASYRAIFLIDIQEIGDNAADALNLYVRRGGGLALFLGGQVSAKSYNANLFEKAVPGQPGRILPGKLIELSGWDNALMETGSADMAPGEDAKKLLGPLNHGAENPFSLVNVYQAWQLELDEPPEQTSRNAKGSANTLALPAVDDQVVNRVQRIIDGRDGRPLVTLHHLGRGRVATVMMGLDANATNWTGDPTFVVFMLQANAALWSGASPPTVRSIDDPIVKQFSASEYSGNVSYVPAATEPPRVPMEVTTLRADTQQSGVAHDPSFIPPTPPPHGDVFKVAIDPQEMVINGEAGLETWWTPGVSEWALMRTDGSMEVEPSAGVIDIGEGELQRADQAEISQALLPTEVRFITSEAWSNQHQAAGSSRLTLLLLAMLGLVLAAEQSIAYWASYHVKEPRA